MDNRVSLPVGYELVVSSNGVTEKILIKEKIGQGGSCLVYKGKKYTSVSGENVENSVVVKEFYPAEMDIMRQEDMSLQIPERHMFDNRKVYFTEGQSKHILFYDDHPDQSLPGMFFFGEANNTVYAISDPGVGRTLTEIDFDSLSINKIASIMEAVCLAIRRIHIKGRLYLDCKPDNFFYYMKRNDLQAKIYLFDFDTIESVKNIKNGKNLICSASSGWVPEEQELMKDPILGNYRYRYPQQIGYHTDIYSIGATFFWLLTQRKPSKYDIERIQEESFDWERESRYCAEAEREVIQAIQEIAKSSLEPRAAVRKEQFRDNSASSKEREKYRKLYGLTVGDTAHFEPIHREINEIKQSLKVLLSEKDNDGVMEEKTAEQNQKGSSLSSLPHYKNVYFRELETSSLEIVAEKIACRILKGECFQLELDGQILPVINKIIYNRKEYVIECQEGMVKVPRGSFIMGGPSRTREYPIKVDYIPYDYWIDLTPVTIAQYRKYLEEAGEINNYGHKGEPAAKSHYPSPDINYGITGPKLYEDYFANPEYDDYPVTFVDWWDAYAYAKWAGKDIPLEMEWEKAARGLDGRIYPYGNEYDSKFCNTDESNIRELTSVDTYIQGASPYGCLDMSGNVWEWCADDFYKNQPSQLKVVKGGSFRRGQNKAMTFSCNPRETMERWVSRGFRCVRRINEDE